jgi:hypothetical protein
MAQKNSRESRVDIRFDNNSLELLDSLKRIAESFSGKKSLTYDEMFFSLRRWWCQHYKRPYKDPLLDSYTFEELAFEYYDVTQAINVKSEEVKVSEKIEDEDRKWAEEEEARELEEMRQLAAELDAKEKDANIEDDGLTDESWAKKYETEVSTPMRNPSADDVDMHGGDIVASFEE